MEKCEDRFQQELDVNTILKRLRYSYNSLSQLKNSSVRKYLRLNETSVVMHSDSSGEDNFDFQVNKGYFSTSDDENPEQNTKVDEDRIQDAFLLQLQDGIEKSLI